MARKNCISSQLQMNLWDFVQPKATSRQVDGCKLFYSMWMLEPCPWEVRSVYIKGKSSSIIVPATPFEAILQEKATKEDAPV